MMESHTFKSRFNNWNYYLYFGLLLLFIGQVIVHDGTFRNLFIGFTIVYSIMLFFYLPRSIAYIITGNSLIVKGGVYKKEYSFSDIQSIRHFQGDGVWKFTNSIGYGKNGLVIWLKSNYQVYISPKDKYSFIATIQTAHPDIVIEKEMQLERT